MTEEDQDTKIYGDQAMKVRVRLGPLGKELGTHISVNQGLKGEVYIWGMIGHPGESLKAKILGDQGLCLWMVLQLKIEDLVVQILGDKVLDPEGQIFVNQGLKREVPQERVILITQETMVQILGDKGLTAKCILDLAGEDLEIQISEDQGHWAEILLCKILGLTGEDLWVEI